MDLNNDNSLLIDLLHMERLNNTEKLLRSVYRIADEFYLVVNIIKYPLTSSKRQYSITIYGQDKLGKWKIKLLNEKGMELEPLLKSVYDYLEKYKDGYKKYNLQKSGGGEMV